MKYVGIFGLSGDPPHKSHLAIVDNCIKRKLVDEVWVLPSYNHTQKKSTATFDQRVKMCKILFGNGLFSKVKVKKYEKWNREGTTINLLKILKELFPSYRFTIIIGADCADNIHTWFDYTNLIKNHHFIVFSREDYHNFKPKKWYRKKPHKFIQTDTFISSTFVRKLVRQKRPNLVELLTSKRILKFIQREKLYEDNTD